MISGGVDRLKNVARRSVPHPEPHHRNIQSGGARAAVFGASDGLVSNASLILGVAGAHPAGSVVGLAGLAGLVAGAFSMAAGELLSMQAQRELLQRELDMERQALRRSPQAERRELAAIYERRGLDPALARDLVEEVMRDPELALETHAREELGINPGELGSPALAALSSFVMFALGALVPLVPWLVTRGGPAIIGSVVAGAVASLVIGGLLGLLTGRSTWRSAMRQLGVAAVAAAVTYGIGRAVGVSGI